jgi:hypothetical protein
MTSENFAAFLASDDPAAVHLRGMEARIKELERRSGI